MKLTDHQLLTPSVPATENRFPTVDHPTGPVVNRPPVGDLICFSHLRWNFVYQRPQHLLTRASESFRVWFIEEPIRGQEQRVAVTAINDRLRVVVPCLKHGTSPEEAIRIQREMMNDLIRREQISEFVAWYYTPMALLFTNHLRPRLTIYDCMDELSAFLGAPPQLLQQEKELLSRAGLVFTGGYSLYEAKHSRHSQVFAFPSSIDFAHFSAARQPLPDPADQRDLPRPRIGFAGVIDERFDVPMMSELITMRPDWQFVFVGPVVKIKRSILPTGPNIHYPGLKTYQELPAYFSNWDVAVLPFARNESTRYISPTKTPEYLAAGLPAVSTSIRDVVRTYGNADFVQIADTAEGFAQAIETALQRQHPADWGAIDEFLQDNSWDKTWQDMNRLIQAQLRLVVEQ